MTDNIHEKDVSEKSLESYKDVYADILNVLLFNGEHAVKPCDISDASEASVIKVGNSEHMQNRDIAKYWTQDGLCVALIGLENQTEEDKDMLLRALCYDSSEYRKQIIDKSSKMRYPIITLVLYFGNKHWNGPRSLKEYFRQLQGDEETKRLREKILDYIGDYKLNVFEIAYLEDDVVAKFRSDFKIIADYFVQVRKNKSYKPPEDKIRHVYEVLQLMKALTGDERFVYQTDELKGRNDVTMSEALTKYFEEAYEQGEAKGEARGVARGKAEERKKVIHILNKKGMDSKTISDMLDMDIGTVRNYLDEK